MSMIDLPSCKKELRSTPPVWVTDTGYDSEKGTNREPNINYVKGKVGDAGEGPLMIPRRSVVQVSGDFAELFETEKDLKGNANKWVPVKVLSVPPENTTLAQAKTVAIASVAKPKFGSLAQKPQEVVVDNEKVRAGTVGRMRLGDLEKVSGQKDFIFIVKKDSVLFRALTDPSNPLSATTEPFALELMQVNGKFQVNFCCDPTGKICKDFPIFKVLGVKNKNGNQITFASPCEDCALHDLIPMKKDFAEPIEEILRLMKSDKTEALRKLSKMEKLNFVDTRGLVQIPVVNLQGDNEGQLGPFGSYHYSKEPGNADVYLKPEVACGFMQVLKTWNEKYCPTGKHDCRIEFGNASHAFYKSGQNPNAWGHSAEHNNGECIDIRPFQKGATGPGGGRSFTSNYNQKDFQKLMKIFDQLGPDSCFLTDRKVTNAYLSCTNRDDHDDHLHICFPTHINKNGKTIPNPKLQKACQKGVQ